MVNLNLRLAACLLSAWIFMVPAFGETNACAEVAKWCVPPKEYPAADGESFSPLRFPDRTRVRNAFQWQDRRAQILDYWSAEIGGWPEMLGRPEVETISERTRENFTEKKVRIELSKGLRGDAYILVPEGQGPFPAVLVVYYDPETSIGTGTQPLRDFAYQLTKRGFVTMAIGSPGGDARKPDIGRAKCQPLSFLAYIAGNCHTALAQMPNVDPKRIGIVGHSYGGKWAMFASCLYDKFACAVWSDPGIVFDESRENVNYWEPWYLGNDPTQTRKPGQITADNARTGAYKRIFEAHHDLHELHALMAPRPFLVSGGSEDTVKQWRVLNYTIRLNSILGATNRVAMTNRKSHDPTEESNQQIYTFFECWLKK